MNDQPPESMLTRYVLENPWPLGIFLFLGGFALIILWLNRGENRLLIAAGACSALMGLTFLLAWVVVTPGEQARAVVHQMVMNAERGDVDGILASISPTASIHLGSLKRPGQNPGPETAAATAAAASPPGERGEFLSVLEVVWANK